MDAAAAAAGAAPAAPAWPAWAAAGAAVAAGAAAGKSSSGTSAAERRPGRGRGGRGFPVAAPAARLRGGSVLHYLVECGDAEALRELRRGAPADFAAAVNRANFAGRTPLQVACATGACAVVEELLRATGVEVDRFSERGCTALHFAAYNGHHRVVQRLLNAGANPSLTSCTGTTAILAAADFARRAAGRPGGPARAAAALRALLRAGADPAAADPDYRRARHLLGSPALAPADKAAFLAFLPGGPAAPLPHLSLPIRSNGNGDGLRKGCGTHRQTVADKVAKNRGGPPAFGDLGNDFAVLGGRLDLDSLEDAGVDEDDGEGSTAADSTSARKLVG